MTKTKTPTKTTIAPMGYPLHSIFRSAVGPQILFEKPGEGAPPAGDPPANPPAEAPPATPPAAVPPSGITDADAKLLQENMKQKAKITELEKFAKAFEGLDPAEVRELVAGQAKAAADAAAAEQENALKRGEFDRVKQQMVDQHTAALKAEQDARKTAEDALAAAAVTIEDLTVGQGFQGSTYIKDNLVLTASIARKEFGGHFDVVDGKPIAYDAPRGAAKRAPIVDAAGQPVAFDVAIERLVDLHPEKTAILRSKQLPGAGSNTTDVKPTEQEKSKSGKGVNRIVANMAALKALQDPLKLK